LDVQTHQLSPAYGLSLIRLAGGDMLHGWAGLLLHSSNRAWAFDPRTAGPVHPDDADQHLTDLTDVRVFADLVGLHRVTEPFTEDLGPADWRFRFPGEFPARISGPGFAVEIRRPMNITRDWRLLAGAHDARCRILVAAGISFPNDPAGAADALNDAADAGRVYGATIGVDF
jgi:hypothetical protein